jgi:amino acid adenylation domain-containing protein
MSNANVEALYPLTPLQQGMLFHAVYGHEAHAHVVQLAYQLHGAVDAPALRRAWQSVLDRHPALRAAFLWERREKPLQVVRRGVELPWVQEDWRGMDPAAQAARLDAFRRDDRARGFELNRAPLMRFTLIRLADDRRELVWTHHHLVSDGWSVALMLRDMVAAYEAYARGESPRLASPPPYAGYMEWLRGRDMAAAEAFWRRALAGFAAPTPLPLARPASAPADGDGDGVAEVRLAAGVELTERLKALSRDRQITLNTLVQGAWALVLARAAGEDDVVFGAVSSGRPVQVAGVEQMVGMFINTLPVRSRIAPGATVAGWLTAFQAEQAEAREHDYTPLVQAQQWSQVPRGTGLFETLVVYENYPVDASLRTREGRTLDIRRSVSTERTSFPVTVIAHLGAELAARILYDTRRLDPAAAERVMGHFRRALEAFAADPDAAVASIELLSAEERALVIDGFNQTATAFPRVGIDALFAGCAAATPGAPAVLFGARTMTYRELDQASNQIARHLQSMGVGAGTRVGICVERSPEMIAGILGIVKAGGAYVPLDPAYPAARLSFMMAETALPVLISTSSLVDSLPEHSARVVLLDADADAIAAESADAVECVTGPESPAYVMYTSGSTGTPKGIVVPHRGVVRLVRETDYITIGADDVFLQLAPVSFDAATLEIWGPLLNGARLAVHPPETPSIDTLEREVAAHGVTVLWLTAGFFHVVVDERVHALRGVRQLLAGGDVLSAPHVRATLQALPGTVVINGYGPTEGTTFTCCHRMEALADDATSVPIGAPIANTVVYVLDAAMRPVPVGVPGELYIGGAGVALGYVSAALTAERFVASPFVAGDTLYRSGDRVRWRADGVVEFLGRMDTQVKIRGFRIEPGEIETALLEIAGVRDAVVIVREDVPGDKRLVAYVVGDADAGGMRDALRGRLPEYMLPSAVVGMDVLPLTENGKVDRRALPAPEAAGAEEGYVPPRTPTEEVLAGIWSEVLSVPQVGARDGFFELGGHSLLATRAVSRIREVFGVELPLRALFEAPVLADLAAVVDGMRGAGETAQAAPPVVPVPRDGALPLSFAQERLWFLDQMEPGSTAYNVPSVLRLVGALDAAAMERALGELISRHESLRTVFATGPDSTPVQVIHPAGTFTLPVIDLSTVAEEARDEAVRAAVREETGRPFDLAAGPLFRAALVRVSDDEHVLALTLHHAVTDGWSMGVLFRELGALYETYKNGAESVLPPHAVQYADHAAWQRAWLAGEPLQRQLAWWKDALAGAPAVLELPTDRPRPAVFSGRGARRTAVLPRELADRLTALGRREGVTLYMTLMAAWQLVLSRWSGQDDVVVGTPIAGRTRAETEGLIGLFVNTLAVRGDLSGDPAFRDLLRRVREATLGAYAHQDVPFEQVVDAVGAGRALSHTPVFQVMFSMQNTPAARVSLAGLELRAAEWELTTAKFDLALTAAETAGGVKLLLDYATDLFDGETIDRMAGHLAAVLQAAAADPARRVSTLPRMTDAEEAELRGWNRTAADVPSTDTLHGLFEAQAARTPDAVAVVCEREMVTYAQLEARANRLARRLVSMGAGAESRIGLCLERGVEMVVAILGTLKAGAAYLPLDPAYPPARLHHMLADAGVAVLLTQERLLDALPEHAARVLCLDCEDAALERESAEPLSVSVDGEQAAYVIYTSGSTGLPKGVVVPHGAICNHMRWMQRRFPLGAADAVLQKTPFSFDASVWEFHAPLMAGARLVMAAPGGHQDPAYLVDAVQTHGITTLQMVPSLLRMLLETEGVEGCGTLQRVFCGGEALPAEWAAELAARLPQAAVNNLYGPTEAAIDATWAGWSPADAHGTVPIGTPIDNLQAHVVDRDGHGLPAGVPGELWLGGAGVARGYLGRPALTAEKFVPDAWSGVPGARAYRTGDRVRRRADGVLEFLGRTDHQVKLRGFRLEPGEVEAALAAHPAVSAAVAMVREDEPGRARLAAWVVAHEGRTADPAELAAHLRGRLPEHMVPTAWAVLDAFPLTPSGKVDRRALPVPGAAIGADGDAGTATPTEQVLASIWEDVLGVEGVGPAAHFFELGGHSLLATRMVARLRAAFRVELPLRAVFEAPVLRALAAKVDAARREDAGWAPAPILSVPREGGLPPSFAQERMWFLDQLEPGDAFYNIPVALRLRGALDADVLGRAVDALVERHEVLRTVFVPGPDGAPLQVVRPATAGTLAIESLEALAEEVRDDAAAARARAEAHAGFDLAAGPVMRATLLRLAHDDHVFLLTLHHAATDGWSTGILFRELWALYGALSEGRESPLAPLPVQYADYAVWQREHLAGERLDGELAYWRGKLAGAPEVLELPADRARPAVQDHRGGRLPIRLDAELAAAVQALSRREGVTPYMTLLAAFQLLLGRWSGQDDVVVGTSIAGRTVPETEPLVGLFANTLALRGDLSGDPTFCALLGRTRETVLEAYAHQEVPFEKLVEALRPERSLSHSPLFQVMFELANTPGSGAPVDGIEVGGFGQALDFAKFDLTLSLWEQAGGFAGVMEYAAALFDAATVERMLGHYRRLLQALVADPDQPVSAAEMMDGAGRAEAIERFNATDAAYPAHLRAHQVFERFAADRPDAPAVRFRGETLTYAELNARANRLAYRLREAGVGAGTVVALLDERGPELLTAVLGVFKAGGAYLPLDPRHPPARIAQVLRQSGTPLVLAAEPFRAVLAAASAAVQPAPRVEDAAALMAEGVPSADLETVCGAMELAYVIYTSGSTGLPKGAMVHHDGMMNHLYAKVVDLALVADDVVAQTASQCFDISVWQMLAALVCGGCTLVLPDEVAGDPAGLLAALDGERVTIAEVVPSLLRVMAEEAASHGAPWPLAALRWMLVTGEALPPAFCREWLAVYPGVPLLNAYGPTECSDDVTHHAVRTPPADDAPRVPIGAAIRNTRLYVVDRALRPVPNGVLGELCVGGAGVGRGYLNEPRRTAGVFVPDPFSATPGARMYRTGDVARRLADGTLEFLGRMDHQVKVRGFRIELGEIEAVLRRHPDVRDAVATAIDDGRGARLVAHVVTPLSAEALIPALRKHVAEALPEYMAPAAYVVMEALPLTPNGKVDRKALPAPDFGADAAAFVAPRTPVEAAVAGVWAELLGVPRVGATDGFFELGGHSLLATRVLARLRETFRVELPLRVLFEAPTVGALAAEMVAREAKPGRTEKIALLLAEIAGMSDDETQAALNGGGTPFTAGV